MCICFPGKRLLCRTSSQRVPVWLQYCKGTDEKSIFCVLAARPAGIGAAVYIPDSHPLSPSRIVSSLAIRHTSVVVLGMMEARC